MCILSGHCNAQEHLIRSDKPELSVTTRAHDMEARPEAVADSLHFPQTGQPHRTSGEPVGVGMRVVRGQLQEAGALVALKVTSTMGCAMIWGMPQSRDPLLTS